MRRFIFFNRIPDRAINIDDFFHERAQERDSNESEPRTTTQSKYVKTQKIEDSMRYNGVNTRDCVPISKRSSWAAAVNRYLQSDWLQDKSPHHLYNVRYYLGKAKGILDKLGIIDNPEKITKEDLLRIYTINDWVSLKERE